MLSWLLVCLRGRRRRVRCRRGRRRRWRGGRGGLRKSCYREKRPSASRYEQKNKNSEEMGKRDEGTRRDVDEEDSSTEYYIESNKRGPVMRSPDRIPLVHSPPFHLSIPLVHFTPWHPFHSHPRSSPLLPNPTPTHYQSKKCHLAAVIPIIHLQSTSLPSLSNLPESASLPFAKFTHS